MGVRGRRRPRVARALVAAAVCLSAASAACASPAPAAPDGGASPAAAGPSVPAPSATSGGLSPSSSALATGGGQAAAAVRCSDRVAAGLSAQRRAAQVLIVGVDARRPPAAGAALARLRVGGVFLRGRAPGSASLRSGVRAVQADARRAGAPVLFVAADEEGGAVQTVRGGTVPPFPTALVQGSWSSRTLAARTQVWGRELARLGVNLDLAPVADVVPASVGRRNPPIGRYGRQYGEAPGGVAAAVATVARALRSVGVGPTVKHFPGLGRVLVNTDTGTGAVDRTTTAADPALRPFTAGTAAGAVAVMVSSARYPRLDAKHPAMWSRPVVTGLLRGRLGWTGMVVSDDLGQAAAAAAVPVGRRAVDFVAAGGDLVLTVRPEQARTMRDALAARARTDAAFRARLDEAVRHVLAAKQTLGLLHC